MKLLQCTIIARRGGLCSIEHPERGPCCPGYEEADVYAYRHSPPTYPALLHLPSFSDRSYEDLPRFPLPNRHNLHSPNLVHISVPLNEDLLKEVVPFYPPHQDRRYPPPEYHSLCLCLMDQAGVLELFCGVAAGEIALPRHANAMFIDQ